MRIIILHAQRHRQCVCCGIVLAWVAVSSLALTAPPQEKQAAPRPEPRELLKQSRRIVFLGDSITAAGLYVAYVEAWLVSQPMPQRPEIICAGLPSETVSGLSEAGHAGGRFPRPDLAERLERVLAIAKPDLVFACYGINCGIYEPFDQERFARGSIAEDPRIGQRIFAHNRKLNWI